MVDEINSMSEGFQNNTDKVLQEEDPEMEEFKKLMNEPLKKPAYKREFYYDFKKYRAKRSFCCLQFVHIFLRYVKEHW